MGGGEQATLVVMPSSAEYHGVLAEERMDA